MLFPKCFLNTLEALFVPVADPVEVDSIGEGADGSAVFLLFDFIHKSVHVVAGGEIQLAGKLSVEGEMCIRDRHDSIHNDLRSD